MTQRAGVLDRKITIETPSTSSGEYGASTSTTWATWKQVYAQVRPVRANERFASSNLRAERSQIFVVRYLAGISEKMRIQYDNKAWNIRGLTELNRRESIEILAEAEA